MTVNDPRWDFQKNIACDISQIKVDNHNPSSHIKQGNEVNNISKTQSDPTVEGGYMTSLALTYLALVIEHSNYT